MLFLTLVAADICLARLVVGYVSPLTYHRLSLYLMWVNRHRNPICATHQHGLMGANVSSHGDALFSGFAVRRTIKEAP